VFDFENQTVVKDINVVPESFRPFFGEDANEKGTFKVKAEDPVIGAAVTALIGASKALKKERSDHAEAKKRAIDLAPLAEFGATPADIRASFDAKVAELTSSRAKIDVEKVKADILAGVAKEKETLINQSKSLGAQLESLLVDNALRLAIGDQAAVDPEFIVRFSKDFMKVGAGEDGRLRAYVVDADGSQRTSRTTFQPMTVTELISELKSTPKYQPFFKSEAANGSGTTPGAAAARPASASSRTIVKEGDMVGLISAGLRNNNR